MSRVASTEQIKGGLYADLSIYYDQFCAEVDYVEQCDFAARVFNGFTSSGSRDHLDLACGTGQHLLHMQQHCFVSSGLDNSAQMLERARLRCPDAQLLLCDIAAFEQVAQFDLITCFLYSIHYSHPIDALVNTLRRAWCALRPGGIFLFDAVDVAGIRNDNRVVTHLRDGDAQLRFESGWEYRGEGEVLDLFLSITRTSPSATQKWEDHHTMTAVSLSQLRILLEEIGFEVTMFEHDYRLLRPWNETSFNAIVLARKVAGDHIDN